MTTTEARTSALEALRNFRDLGGTRAGNGSIARGRIYRTAHLSALAPEAARYLREELAIGAYLDFRETFEIERDGRPAFLESLGVLWVHHPFDISDAAFRGLQRPTVADWQDLYWRAVQRLKPAFVDALKKLAELSEPVVFGCWVGKDRTGLVAAFLLSVLGVEDAVIADDYARSRASLLRFKSDFSELWRGKETEADQLFEAYLGSEHAIMLGFLRQVRAEFGSVESLLELPAPIVSALRQRYLTA